MPILALAGRRFSGKTKIASTFCDMDSRFRVLNFADPIKEEFCKRKGITRDMLDRSSFKEEFRPELLTYSDDMKAKHSKYYFADMLMERIIPGEHVIIGDLRFIEEVHVLKKKDALIYKVETSKKVRILRGWNYDPNIDDHYSETELDLPAYVYHCLGGGVIYNDKDPTNQIQLILQTQFKREISLAIN